MSSGTFVSAKKKLYYSCKQSRNEYWEWECRADEIYDLIIILL